MPRGGHQFVVGRLPLSTPTKVKVKRASPLPRWFKWLIIIGLIIMLAIIILIPRWPT